MMIYHIMRADLLERAHRYSFLITLGVIIAIGYAAVPPATAHYATD